MKKIIFVLLIFLLLGGCKAKVRAISSYQKWDELNDSRKHEVSSLAYDLRPQEACLAGHLPQFNCIFYNRELSLEKVKENIKIVYEKDTLILLMCEDGSISEELASSLVKEGYSRVYYFTGGYNKYCLDNKEFIPETGCNC